MDDQEQPRFRKNDVYTWLDNIRVMGLEQGFPDEYLEERFIEQGKKGSKWEIS